jgi:hypothetical protein
MRSYLTPTAPVKPHRVAPRHPAPFGAGILPGGRTPDGISDLVGYDREPRPALPIDSIDWDELGRQAHLQELAEAGYRFF